MESINEQLERIDLKTYTDWIENGFYVREGEQCFYRIDNKNYYYGSQVDRLPYHHDMA